VLFQQWLVPKNEQSGSWCMEDPADAAAVGLSLNSVICAVVWHNEAALELGEAQYLYLQHVRTEYMTDCSKQKENTAPRKKPKAAKAPIIVPVQRPPVAATEFDTGVMTSKGWVERANMDLQQLHTMHHGVMLAMSEGPALKAADHKKLHDAAMLAAITEVGERGGRRRPKNTDPLQPLKNTVPLQPLLAGAIKVN
jgi:hypothetical protein